MRSCRPGPRSQSALPDTTHTHHRTRPPCGLASHHARLASHTHAASAGRLEANKIKKWWRTHHEGIEGKLRLQRAAASEAPAAGAGGGRAAAKEARRRLLAGGAGA